jgi:hypothetical protein
MSIYVMPMRKHGLLPVILVFLMVIAVYFGYSQGHAITPPKSLMPEMPVDGGIFLLLTAAIIYGGKVLSRQE